jgi:hypothetical protein
MHPDTLQLIAAERLADLRRSGRPLVKAFSACRTAETEGKAPPPAPGERIYEGGGPMSGISTTIGPVRRSVTFSAEGESTRVRARRVRRGLGRRPRALRAGHGDAA